MVKPLRGWNDSNVILLRIRTIEHGYHDRLDNAENKACAQHSNRQHIQAIFILPLAIPVPFDSLKLHSLIKMSFWLFQTVVILKNKSDVLFQTTHLITRIYISFDEVE